MNYSFRKFIHEKREGKHFLFKIFFKILDKVRSSFYYQKILIDYNYFLKKYESGYYWERLKKIKLLKNLYAGKRCFILGSGPSVNLQDLSGLSYEYVICVNQSYLIPSSNYGFYPNAICLSDSGLYEKIKTVYEALPSNIVFSTGPDGKIGIDYKGNNLAAIIRIDTLKRAWEGNFSADLETGICLSYNVITDLAIPLAIYMGFKKIYLLGCDADEKGYSYNQINGYIKSVQYISPKIFSAYSSIKKYCDHNKIEIYNSGVGGKLEIFERVPLEKVV